MKSWLRIVGGKWKSIIVARLNRWGKRFGQLDVSIMGISRKVVPPKISEIVRDKIKNISSFNNLNNIILNSLTDKGKELIPIFKAIGKWGRYLVEEE